MAERLTVDAIVNPTAARVLIARREGIHGGELSARFDLNGLPRIESALLGRPVETVPELTKRLCGICPVAHHLAGIRALETLLGYSALPPSVRAIRSLLALGSELDQLAPRLVFTAPALARTLRRAGKAAMTAAGAPGHFPDVAVPGGVRSLASQENIEAARAALKEAQHALAEVGEPQLSRAEVGEPQLSRAEVGEQQGTTASVDGVTEAQVCSVDAEKSRVNTAAGGAQPGAREGYNNTAHLLRLALVDHEGNPDVLGMHIAVVDDRVPDDGALGESAGCVDMWTVSQWNDHIRETNPGSAAPRPEVVMKGKWTPYRVGPASGDAHVRIAGLVAQLAELLTHQALTRGEIQAPTPTSHGGDPTRYGIGVIDGPRGLLVHEYWADADGILTDCRILTPTAQNEPWLAQMLTSTVTEAVERMSDPRSGKPGSDGGAAQPETGGNAMFDDDGTALGHGGHAVLDGGGGAETEPSLDALAAQLSAQPDVLLACEDAIRAADPCLPCTMAPRGAMGLTMTTDSLTGR